jgi:hypothetical protein
MPRFYCDFCDAYLTHDSVSIKLKAAAVSLAHCSTADHRRLDHAIAVVLETAES